MYSFVREADPTKLEDGHWTWDPDDVIRDAVAMSRLVLDNGYSTEYAARIFDYANGEQQITPTAQATQYAYRLRPQAREWMKVSETDELRELLAAMGPLMTRSLSGSRMRFGSLNTWCLRDGST